jgi:hypothetical protein
MSNINQLLSIAETLDQSQISSLLSLAGTLGSDTGGKIAELINTVEGLDASQIELLTNMAKAMQEGVDVTVGPASDLLSAGFVSAFSNILRMHHANHTEKLNKQGFEYAFTAASSAAGRAAAMTGSGTHPGADVVVDGVGYSLKTEAAQGIRPRAIVISKLMEARWIRDCQTPDDFAAGTREHIVKHLQQYERILMLRAFKLKAGGICYDLWEIPRSLLLEMEKLKGTDFRPKAKSGGSRADVNVDGEKVFTLNLDGSVEKVQILNLAVSRCSLHGSWTISPTRFAGQ